MRVVCIETNTREPNVRLQIMLHQFDKFLFGFDKMFVRQISGQFGH